MAIRRRRATAAPAAAAVTVPEVVTAAAASVPDSLPIKALGKATTAAAPAPAAIEVLAKSRRVSFLPTFLPTQSSLSPVSARFERF